MTEGSRRGEVTREAAPPAFSTADARRAAPAVTPGGERVRGGGGALMTTRPHGPAPQDYLISDSQPLAKPLRWARTPAGAAVPALHRVSPTHAWPRGCPPKRRAPQGLEVTVDFGWPRME